MDGRNKICFESEEAFANIVHYSFSSFTDFSLIVQGVSRAKAAVASLAWEWTDIVKGSHSCQMLYIESANNDGLCLVLFCCIFIIC
jgi:hypothetical protein